MAQRPHTIVYEVHATPDVQRYRAECAKLSGFGATPLDAIRELLDAEEAEELRQYTLRVSKTLGLS